MNFLNQFVIPISSLEPGDHQFDFTIDEQFFEKFDESEVKQGKVQVHVDVQKQATMVVMNFELKGSVGLVCDRCLGDFDYPFSSTERLIVKYGAVSEEESDEIITIQESEHELNIAQYLYEYIHLTLPMKRIHPEDEQGNSLCDKEVLKKLEELEIKEEHQDEADPRWDVLKNIKFN